MKLTNNVKYLINAGLVNARLSLVMDLPVFFKIII